MTLQYITLFDTRELTQRGRAHALFLVCFTLVNVGETNTKGNYNGKNMPLQERYTALKRLVRQRRKPGWVI